VPGTDIQITYTFNIGSWHLFRVLPPFPGGTFSGSFSGFEALALAAAGGEVILLDGSTPRARLVPFGSLSPRTAGLHAGALQPAADFDAPLSDDFWAEQS
jgi:hypothetical protein